MLKFMLKTALLGAVAAGAAVAIVGPDKVQDWVYSSKKVVEEQINEFQGMTAELRKIESRVHRLDAEIEDLKEGALKEEYELKNLSEEVQNREESMEYLRDNLEKAQSLLNSELDRFNIRGINYTRNEIEQDVAEKMRVFQVQEDTLSQLRQTMTTRQNAMDMARENVARGQAVREELVARVRLLQAKLERYEARQVYAEAVAMDFDAREFNTEIGEARQQLALFEQKLEVKNRMLDDEMRVAMSKEGVISGIDYTQTAKSDASVADQLSALLNGENADLVAANK